MNESIQICEGVTHTAGTFVRCNRPATVTFRLKHYCRECRYRAYLKSSAWERVRARKLRQAGAKCEACGDRGGRGKNGNVTGLNVHHLNYDRVGDERDDDLIVLCRRCHEKRHGITQ